MPSPAAGAAAAVAPAVNPDAMDAPPRSYRDFSRPVTAAPAAAPAAAAPVAAAVAPIANPNAVTAPPRSYSDFSRPVGAPGSPAAESDAPRTYSVHREYGRQPDHPQMPEPVYLDQLGPSEDLAAPPPPLMNERDERRARAAAADPDGPAPGL
jgi:hypothetical protein